MKITKAVIPAAGLGTRVLPASKAVPKEMLPIVDKPALQYLIEEAVDSGITDILVITNRGKSIIEDHFDRNIPLEESLLASNKKDLYDSIIRTHKLANISYIRQIETNGLGHAVSKAKAFVGNEPFAILYGDDVVYGGKSPATKELIDAYGEFGKGVLGIKEVPEDEIFMFSSLKVENIHDNVYKCTDMIEKPQSKEAVLSCYSILGRCILPPEIFDILSETKPGRGGEIQLTDAMKVLANTYGMTAVEYTGEHLDMGSKIGMLKASIKVGLEHKEIGEELRKYIKEIAENL